MTIRVCASATPPPPLTWLCPQHTHTQRSYPLSCVDRVVCPITCINMHYFFERTLDPAQLEASLCRLVTKHPFLAGTFRGWLQVRLSVVVFLFEPGGRFDQLVDRVAVGRRGTFGGSFDTVVWIATIEVDPCMKKSLPTLTHNHLPSPIYQSACVVCDDHGVEFTVAESAWSVEDVHYASPALERLSQYEPCGFGAGAWVGMCGVCACLWMLCRVRPFLIRPAI